MRKFIKASKQPNENIYRGQPNKISRKKPVKKKS